MLKLGESGHRASSASATWASCSGAAQDPAPPSGPLGTLLWAAEAVCLPARLAAAPAEGPRGQAPAAALRPQSRGRRRAAFCCGGCAGEAVAATRTEHTDTAETVLARTIGLRGAKTGSGSGGPPEAMACFALTPCWFQARDSSMCGSIPRREPASRASVACAWDTADSMALSWRRSSSSSPCEGCGTEDRGTRVTRSVADTGAGHAHVGSGRASPKPLGEPSWVPPVERNTGSPSAAAALELSTAVPGSRARSSNAPLSVSWLPKQGTLP